jgi:hypothetical protein
MREIEKNTNRVFRKKYFTSTSNILVAKKKDEAHQPVELANILDAAHISVSDKPVLLGSKTDSTVEAIHVSVRRKGTRIDGISISCPCGRHADLDCEYDGEARN